MTEPAYVQTLFNRGVELQIEGKLHEAEVIFNRILNRTPQNVTVLHRLAYLYQQMEFNGLAINLLEQTMRSMPDDPDLLNDMGVLYRKENFFEAAEKCYLRSIEKGGETAMNCSNLAGMYADSCRPAEALKWCDKAVAIDSENPHGHWQRALALLTQRRWSEGWDEYQYRQQLDTWDSRKTLEVPVWNGQPVKHLYVHGEQGIGDEVMFLSCLDKALEYTDEMTVECHPSVAAIVRRTWPHVRVFTKETKGNYDAKTPIGSLCQLFRREEKDFPGTPYLKPSQKRVEYYRRELEKLGPGPYLALTWMGGQKATRVEQRTFGLRTLRPIMDNFTCVSAQYNHTNPELEPERKAEGLAKLGDDACGRDIAEQVALFKAVDAVVTAQQTAVHVAGSVGANTYVLLPSNPHWRYGLESFMPWYKSVKLYRKSDTWANLVQHILGKLNADFGRISGTQQKAA